jgi:phosphomannomutase/phosphoglucomutase
LRKIFGTNGVRGITNKDLTPELALRIGKSIGTYFKKGDKLLVGRDVRAGGDMLVRALTSGLLSTGIEVHYAGMLPTPTLQYSIKNGDYAGGVMVTASHNPAEFNGIKVIDHDGIETSNASEEKIEEHYFKNDFREVPWQELDRDVKDVPGAINEYIKGVMGLVDVAKIRARKFKVLIDCANSVGSVTTPRLAKELGCEIQEANTRLDPLFPGRQPEPTPGSLAKTAEMCRSLKVDIGVAHDGDADRAIFIDSEGRVHLGDKSGALLAYWAALKDGKDGKTVFTPFSSSDMIEEFLGMHGIRTERTKVGSIYVSRSLTEHGGIAGFEDNGGFIYPKHQCVRDGAMAFAFMLDFLASQDKSSAQIFDQLPVYFIEKIKLPINGIDTELMFRDIKSKYGKDGKIMDTDHDGLKMAGNGFWFIVRKSGTEPVLRISVEAKEKAVLDKTLGDLKKLAGS